MKKYIIAVLMYHLLLQASAQQSASMFKPELPVLFAEAPLNTRMNERDMAISPDGSEMFYSIYIQVTQFHVILYCKKDKHNKWSIPQIASFSGRHSDMEPAFSNDGKKLFFSSNRQDSASERKDFDIWMVEKVDGQWINAKNIGGPVNTEADEYFPSVAANGNLYFTADYKHGLGKEDIFVAGFSDGRYQEPVPLESAVNSAFYEFNAFISPDESFIVFTSYGRKDDKGRGDLYVSSKDEKGKWLPAKNLASINSDKLDYCPFVSFDKKTLYFTSERHSLPADFPDERLTYDLLMRLYDQPQNGSGNIYQVSWESVLKSMH
jgi:WD40-like Beta Propeller Repeat